MLRFAYIFICIILFSTIYAQPQREPVYKYSYDFSITTSSACSGSFAQDSVSISRQQPLFEIELKDCKNSPIPFATVLLKRNDSLPVYSLLDEKGRISMPLTEGEYTLTISSAGSESFIRKVTLKQYYKQHLTIVLQARSFTEHYTVSSKIKLTEKDIDKIKRCITIANGIAYKCGEKREYVISTWI